VFQTNNIFFARVIFFKLLNIPQKKSQANSICNKKKSYPRNFFSAEMRKQKENRFNKRETFFKFISCFPLPLDCFPFVPHVLWIDYFFLHNYYFFVAIYFFLFRTINTLAFFFLVRSVGNIASKTQNLV
jgi:hypothetical protein